jgi:flagellar hook assembly protein FlgD
VDIAVFDMLGRRVKTLFHGRQQAGRYQVFWNGSTETGAKAPSGSYAIRMQADSAALVQKVVLMK